MSIKKIITTTFLFLTVSILLAQQYPEVKISGSETRMLTSTIIDGQEYELQIQLPSDYKTSDKTYPVVYLMDSQWDFPLVSAIYGQQYYDGFVPGFILVGVTWANGEVLRGRDYTPSANGVGGADLFLDFMQKELFPFIEKNYRVDATNKTLMGCSLGGLFTMYTLLTHTDMFTGYVAASPYLAGLNKEKLFKMEETFSQKQLSNPLHVYMTVGDVETARPLFEQFAKKMEDSDYKNVRLHSKVLENTGHSGTKSETYSRGLQFVFERNKLKLDNAILNKYVGTYQTDNGNKLQIVNEDNALYLMLSPTDKLPLFANTENHFYGTFQFFNMYFKETDGKVEGFDLKTYESEQTLKKVN
ncbi:prolyl oligopeptidase family serine peptidase [Flavobacteriaceae bacterium XHP0103]|uniref:alpha/beta hydrolase n=1 Tax=Marixanthotalea marina TaxID=2844359 RepID=UPI002989F493|nr:alpha/beta hydrolase-fold protein [Marixanthotalea marina]MBU3821311.1 prolyl oligopeptidase family serine peptidase [Marixanthotalea marina]